MSIVKRILSPTFFGCGVGLFLYANMDKLPMPAYLVNIPFYAFVVFPSGLLWKNKILANLNTGQFPPQMKSYREMFVYSRKAIIYQLVLNQIGYHTFLGLTFLGFTYYARTFYDKTTPRKPALQFFKESMFGFFKLRFIFATISLLSQFWGAKLNLVKNAQGGIQISSNAKRALLVKQTILNLLWMTSVAYLAHQHYPQLSTSSSDASSRLTH